MSHAAENANNKRASAQSNQRLCHSLLGKHYIQTYHLQNVDILSSLGICSSAGRAGTNLVGNPEDRFFRAEVLNDHYAK